MTKEFNKAVTSDIPLEESFMPSENVEKAKKTTTPKAKISAIGKNTVSRNKTTTANRSKSQTTKTAKTTKNENSKKSNTAKSKETIENTEEKIEFEKTNEENIKTYRFKAKRNKFVITILSVLLAITIIGIVVFAIISRLETNCHMYAHGVEATFIVDGIEMDEFRTPSNLQGNSILRLDIKLNIHEEGEFIVKFTPLCYQKNVLMDNTLIYEASSLFHEGGDGFYYSNGSISGKQIISLCGGIILDYEYKESLSVNNFRLDFHVYVEKV